jgi:hypothetical protein
MRLYREYYQRRMGNRVFTSLQDQRKAQNNVEGNKTVSREIKKEEKIYIVDYT